MKQSMLVRGCRVLAVLALFPLVSSGHDPSLDVPPLAQQVDELYRQSEYAEALPLAERVLQIQERVSNSTDIATALSQIARLHMATGVYADAQPLLRRVLTLRERALGAEHPETAFTLHTLATASYLAGDYAHAEPWLRRALAIRERVLGPEHLDTSKTLNNLANLYFAKRDFAGAEPLYQRVLAIREKQLGAEHPDTASVLGNLAILYAESLDFEAARQTYQRVLQIQEHTLGPADPRIADSLNNLANIHIRADDVVAAEPLLLRALAIREQALGPEHLDVALVLHSLAEIYARTGADARAEPLHRRALRIREAALGPDHPDVAQSLDGLASLAEQRMAYAEALPLYERALAIREARLSPDDPVTIGSLNDVASLLVRMGEYERVQPLLEKALAASRRALGGEDSYTSVLLDTFGELRLATGRFAEAVTLFEQALAIIEQRAGEGVATTQVLNSLAAGYWAANRPALALRTLQHAQRNQVKTSARFLLAGSQARKLDYLQRLANDASRSVSFSLTHSEPDAVRLGLDSVLEYKGRALDSMSGSLQRLRQSVQPQQRALLDELADVARQLSLTTYQDGGERNREYIAELTARQEQLEADLARRSPAFREQLSVPAAAVSRAIPDDAVLLEWFRYVPFEPNKIGQPPASKRYLVYVLRNDAAPQVIDIGDAASIERLIAEFLAAARSPRRTDITSLGRKLGERLFEPLQAQLHDATRLLISPDGALHVLPMAALLDESGRYLLERFEISYLTSSRDLLRMPNRTPSRSRPVIVAAPDYGPAEGLRLQAARASSPSGELKFANLPGARREALAVQTLLERADPRSLLGADATEANVKRLHGPSILHIATHGFFRDDEAPRNRVADEALLRSGLALAGANLRHSGDEDGILTAAEAAQLDLAGTQLVVLSACESGLGQVSSGEGVFGLRRAFALAGAQSQLSSLWQLADAPTQVLIEDYYRGLVRGEGRAAALRAAQQQMLARPERAHPYFWASLIHIGNWQPVNGLSQ